MKNLIFDVQRFASEITKAGTYSESGTAASPSEYSIAAAVKVTQTGSYVKVTNYVEPAFNAKGVNTNPVTFTNKGAFVSYTGNDGIDNITNQTERKNIALDSKVTLDGGAGDDVITNIAGGKAVISGGDGKDKITSSGENTVIDGGKGDDTITLNYTTEKIYGMSQGHYGHGTSISGGEGNDKISVVAGTEKVTIDGGAGTNTIYVGNGENTIIINAEDKGQNVIYGLNDNTKLNITGEMWGKQVSGSDYIFNVSPTSSATDTTTTVTLKAAAGSDLNLILNGKAAILSATQTPNRWSVENGTAKYGTDVETLITITGLSSNATEAHLSLDGTVVTVSDAALNNEKTVSITNHGKVAYTLALGSDVTAVQTVENNWDLKKTKGIAIYHAGTSTNGYDCDGKKISFVNSANNVSATITGLSSNMTESDFTYDEGTITIAANALGNKNVSVVSDNGDEVSIKAGDDAPTADSWGKNSWVVRGDVASYYAKAGNLASYTTASDGKSITYARESNSTPTYVLSGLSDKAQTTDFAIDTRKKTITVGASALDSTKTVSEDIGAFSLALGSDVSEKSSVTAANWSVSGGAATYKSDYTSKGYAVTSTKKSIVYNQESGGEILAVLEGLNKSATSGVTTKNNVITVAKAALPTADTVDGGSLVTLTSGADSYTLALSGVTLSKVTSEVLTFKGTTATYDGVSTSAGYYVDGNVVKYTPKKSSDHAVISGLKKGASKKNVTVDGYKITLSKAALGTTNVKVSNEDFTFVLDGDVEAPVAASAAWEKGSVKVGKKTEEAMIYKSAGTTAGYTVATVDDKSEVVYTKAVAQTNLAAIQNFKSNATEKNFTTKGTEISFAGTAVNSTGGGAQVSVATADAYSFALTSAGAMTNIGAAVSLIGGAKTASTLTGGKATNDTIIGGTAADVLSGGAGGNNYIDGGAGNDNMTGGTGNDTLVSSAGTNTFDGGAGNDLMIGGSGVDNMTGGAGNDSIIAGAGNDIAVSGGAGNDYIDGGAGNDNLNGEAGNDTLFGGDGNDTLQGTAGVNYLDGGKGNDKLLGGSGVDTLNGGDGADTAEGGAGNDIINGGDGNDSLVGAAGNDTIFGDAGNDVLVGGDGNDLLWGGDATVTKGVGGDTLEGGAGNDTLIAWQGTGTLKGGDGNDVFVCSILDKTTATVADFAGADKVAIDYFGAIDSIKTTTIKGSENVNLVIGLKDTLTGTASTLTVNNVATNQAFGVTDLSTNKAVTAYTGKYNKTTKETNPDTGGEITTTTDATEKFTFKTVADWIAYGELLPSLKAYTPSESGLWFDDDSEFVTAGNISEITSSESVLLGEVEPNALYSNLMQAKKELEVYASK